MSKEDLLNELKELGLDDYNTKNLLKNEKKTKIVLEVKKLSGLKGDVLKAKVGLILQIASKVKLENHREFLSKKIGSGDINSSVQLEEGIKFLNKLLKDDKIDVTKFDKLTGVGINIDNERIKKEVSLAFKGFENEIKKERYSFNIGKIMGVLKKGDMKWADGKLVKEAVDNNLLLLLGEKTKEDEENMNSKKKKKKVENKNDKKNDKKNEKKIEKKEENKKEKKERKFDPRALEDAKNPTDIYEEYLKKTGGKIICRFPPEPNGYLHIGHAKAMNLSFGHAKDSNGECILRFDDTNPTTEKEIYFRSIKEMVNWMGFKPSKVTNSSDYFQEMYELAIKLIKKGLAYCDDSTPKQIKEQRDKKIDSPCRNRSVEENLKIFELMKKGRYGEGEMVLRAKFYNAHLRDFICYRIKYQKHARSGDKWCIYPSYDYSHCIVDSLEWISHSLCTLEFETRRESYYWLLKVLDLYRPLVWEFSKLNITKNILSKRNIKKLVDDKFVRGWDDPRLFTLAGLRRRGYKKEAILNFCDDVGVTRNDSLIDIERLEQSCRSDLDKNAKRKFVILDPLMIKLTNFDKFIYVDAQNHPVDSSKGSRKLPFSNTIYIERRDFRELDSKNYYGLSLNKDVSLKYAFNIKCTKVIKKDGNIISLEATVDLNEKKPCKGTIHWLSSLENGKPPSKAEVRIYDYLFNIEEPGKESNWEKYLNKDSEIVLKNCLIEESLLDTYETFTNFQFERNGYFCLDSDSKKGSPVFNRTVTMKSTKTKY